MRKGGRHYVHVTHECNGGDEPQQGGVLPGDRWLASIWNQVRLGQVPASPLTSCVALDKSPLLLELQVLLCELSHPQRGLPSSLYAKWPCPACLPPAPSFLLRHWPKVAVNLVCSFFGVLLPVLECKLHESMDFCLFYSLLYLQDPAQCWHTVGTQ